MQRDREQHAAHSDPAPAGDHGVGADEGVAGGGQAGGRQRVIARERDG